MVFCEGSCRRSLKALQTGSVVRRLEIHSGELAVLCYRHPSAQAIGACKACYKGICPDCAFDTGNGLACTESCQTMVANINEMNERSLKIYGIGRYKSKLPPSGVLMWGAFSILGWAAFAAIYLVNGEAQWGILVPTVFFSIVTLFAFYSSRRTGLNC